MTPPCYLNFISKRPNRGRPDVLQCIFQLVLDRKLNTHTLPEGWSIVAAGNPATDDFFVTDLDQALMNRFCHIKYDIDYKTWSDYAKKNGLGKQAIEFVNTFKPFDKKKELEYNLNIIPTPRGVEMAIKLLPHLPNVKTLCRETIMGLVGLETATLMLQHLDGEKEVRITISEILGFNDKAEEKLTKLIKDGRLDTINDSFNSLMEYVSKNHKMMKGAQIKKMFNFLSKSPLDMVQRILLAPDFEIVFGMKKFTENGGSDILNMIEKEIKEKEPKTK